MPDRAGQAIVSRAPRDPSPGRRSGLSAPPSPDILQPAVAPLQHIASIHPLLVGDILYLSFVFIDILALFRRFSCGADRRVCGPRLALTDHGRAADRRAGGLRYQTFCTYPLFS